jgi:DNA-binding MarR family transcriptional regulator
LLGALLRRAHDHARQQMLRHLVAAGFDDIRPSDFIMLQYPAPDGIAPSELAAERRLSKQMLNHLLGEMETRGYFERRPDPRDGRGVLIVPTRRGRALMRAARQGAIRIEEAWRRQLGERRFAIVRRAIEEMGAASAAASPSAPPPRAPRGSRRAARRPASRGRS